MESTFGAHQIESLWRSDGSVGDLVGMLMLGLKRNNSNHFFS